MVQSHRQRQPKRVWPELPEPYARLSEDDKTLREPCYKRNPINSSCGGGSSTNRHAVKQRSKANQGDLVVARWPDGMWYKAKIDEVSLAEREYLVTWEDGDPSHRVIGFADVARVVKRHCISNSSSDGGVDKDGDPAEDPADNWPLAHRMHSQCHKKPPQPNQVADSSVSSSEDENSEDNTSVRPCNPGRFPLS